MNNRLVIIGNPEDVHIGAHLVNAARGLGINVQLCDIREGFNGPLWLTKINWHMLGHRPNRLKDFSQKAAEICLEFKPKWLIVTGIAPLKLEFLIKIKKSCVLTINYLTDDPWNAAHRTSWFKKTLSVYDKIFSPRHVNITNLEHIGCRNVSYMPFAYAPELHFPQGHCVSEIKVNYSFDIVFVGNADRDRIYYVSALIDAGFRVGLYGNYWERFRKTKPYAYGYVRPELYRKVLTDCKIALCLVRRANRDGHSMRSFEIPAIGACMLTEDTEEHREIFGEEGENVTYFKNSDEMIQKTKFLLSNNAERNRLANNAHLLIINGRHAYRDRLIVMLERD